jgi:hypothetical protein
MKNVRGVLSIGCILIVGVLLVGAFYMKGNSASEESPEFSAAEAKAASNLTVKMPPAPAPTTEKAMPPDVKAASSVGSVCTGSDAQNFDCYQTYYTDLVKNKGIPAAFADLKARYAENSYVQSQCHPITHVIGRVAAESYTKVSEAYTHGDSFCWSGYYHGVLETFAHRIGLKNLNAQINNICADLNVDGKYSFDYFNCVHGIGHGLMAVTDDELFKSLDYCTALKGDWEQQSCAGGVYMENVIADGLNHVTNYLDPKRPLYPCSDSPDKYKNTCYLMQTSYMLKVNSGDFAKTFQWCRDAGQYQDTCDQSLGRDASGRSVSDGPRTKKTCMLGGTEREQSNCVIGAVKDFTSYFHSDKQATAFCNLFDDPIKKACLETLHSYYQSF